MKKKKFKEKEKNKRSNRGNEREKIAMENLKNQMEKEKQYQIDRRNRIKQAQYEDYNNYLRQKYSTPPENREKLNIKLGGEQRNNKKFIIFQMIKFINNIRINISFIFFN